MIYLLRHGEIADGSRKRFIGKLDIPLTENGRLQIERWKYKLAHIDFDKIYSSDLVRCKETSQIIARKKEVYFLKELREINLGEWEGLFHEDVKTKYPMEWVERGGNHLYRPPGGESFDDLRKRVTPAFEKIASMDLNNVLIVTHAGVIRVIISHILQIPDERVFSIGLDYAAMNLIDNKKIPFQLLAMNLTL